MKTVYSKLSLALLLVLILAGLMFFAIESRISTINHEEITQRLNSPIAMYVVGERQLINNGEPDREVLQTLAQQAMVINPSVEVYLLDPEGRILGHAIPEKSVRRTHVDLEPILRLLANPEDLPLHGDDPRGLEARKIFSVAPIFQNDNLQGYLYAILGGALYDALALDANSSYARRMSALSIAALALLAFAIGAILFALLTRRFRHLRRTVQSLAGDDFMSHAGIEEPRRHGDEIDELEHLLWRMSARIKDQFERLQETDRLRRELVANVSHDLRTPLASMQGYIETLIIKDAALSIEKRGEYLQIARKHTRRLAELVSDLFELSKLDANSVQPHFESFSLAELLQDLIQDFQLQAKEQGVILIFEQSADAATVFADIGLIQRVLENLVKNALQHTPSGGQVRVQVATRSSAVAVAVQDSGHGIAEEDIPRIFDRFYRARHGEESRSDSSGLGLAIVKKILDLHESRVTIESRLNTGTRIEFELPALQIAA